MKDVIDRVKKYLEQHALSRALDQESIYGFHIGTDREAILKVSDIKELIMLSEGTLRNLSKMENAVRTLKETQSKIAEIVALLPTITGNAQTDQKSLLAIKQVALGAEEAKKRLNPFLVHVPDTLDPFDQPDGPLLPGRQDVTITPVIPEGFQLVPVEPTWKMQQAFKDAHSRKCLDIASVTPTEHPDDGGGPIGYGWRAMLGAAPEAPNIKYEAKLKSETDCPACGGSGHIDDARNAPFFADIETYDRDGKTVVVRFKSQATADSFWLSMWDRRAAETRLRDLANEMFTLDGFMTCSDSTVKVKFPELSQAQKFHNALVNLSKWKSE